MARVPAEALTETIVRDADLCAPRIDGAAQHEVHLQAIERAGFAAARLRA